MMHIFEYMVPLEGQSDVYGFFHCLIGWVTHRCSPIRDVTEFYSVIIMNECFLPPVGHPARVHSWRDDNEPALGQVCMR